jgi:hypothetical protein
LTQQPQQEVVAMPIDDIAADSLTEAEQPKSRADWVFAVAGDWALASDGIKWIDLSLTASATS